MFRTQFINQSLRVSISSLILFFVPVITFAAPRTFPDFVYLLVSLIDTAVAVVVGLAVLGFFWGVTKYMFSAEDTTKLEEGKKVMVWGLIALFVMVSVWGILRILTYTFLF